MSNIRRYGFKEGTRPYIPLQEDGMWVLYEDHMREVEWLKEIDHSAILAMEQRAEHYQAALERIVNMCITTRLSNEKHRT